MKSDKNVTQNVSKITPDIKRLVKKFNPERYEIIIKHWEELEETSMLKWSSCLFSFLEEHPNFYDYNPDRELNACLRSFHNEKICPYSAYNAPCRF